MDLSLAIAQGFHNAPRLYGDTTVRTPPRISGIKSGLRAAGSEFTYGVYDGVTGLVMQPYKGARENGALGLVQGIGKGFGGFVLKDLAAIIGPFGYTLKGVHKELIKGRQPTPFVRKARIIQGARDADVLDTARREREVTKVETAWRIICDIRNEEEAQKEEGLKARITVLKDQNHGGTYETVGVARRVLESKREDREERESVAAARNSEEGRKGSRMFGGRKKGGFGGDARNGGTKGADRGVRGDVLDLQRGREKVDGQDGARSDR